MIKIAYINFWDQPKNDMWFTKFIEHNISNVKCVEYYENPDILFCSCFGNKNVNNIKAKCKIFFYGENLNNFPRYNNEKYLYDTYDLILGFKYTNPDKKLLRFPLWLMYYDFYDINTDNNILNYIQIQYQNNCLKKKDIYASIVANHDRGGQRIKIIKEFEKHGKIMSPAPFYNNTNRIGRSKKDKINYISNGIYNICPENSEYEGYFTEKIFQAFEGGTIPIYWAINLPEIDIINRNKYCFCNIYDKENMTKSIEDAVKFPEKYLKGNLFTDNAKNIVDNYYKDLIYNIKRLLCI